MNAILHLVFRSFTQGDGLILCLDHATDGDALVLLEEAVVNALELPGTTDLFMPEGLSVYVIKADLDLRGLGDRPLAPGVEPIDYRSLVDLVTHYKLSQTWS
jgi:tRNA 2-thiouridine synthesizing protein B